MELRAKSSRLVYSLTTKVGIIYSQKHEKMADIFENAVTEIYCSAVRQNEQQYDIV